MAQETSNYKLIKPDDGALQWGEDLNTNFDTIDRGLSSLATSAANTLVCVGLFGNPSIQYSGIQTIDTLTVCTQIDFIKLNCYFPTYENNAGIVQSNKLSLLIDELPTIESWENNEYKVYNLLLSYDEDKSGVTLNFTFKETLKDGDFAGKEIYLGTLTLIKLYNKIYFVRDLCCFTPWFASYTLKDRIENFNTTGVVQNLILQCNENDNKSLVSKNSTYNWYLEGINFKKDTTTKETTWETNNSIATDFLEKDSSGILSLYMAVDNNKYNTSELTPRTTIDAGKYWTGSEITPFTGKYVIYRISVVKNQTLGVFYPTTLYDTFNEARSAAMNLDPLQTSIPQKEVARLITNDTFSKVEIYNFYSDEYVAEGINSYLFYTDPQKEGYTLADASEIRSNGILPIYGNNHYITLSGTTLTAKGVGCIVDSKYNFQESTLVNYFEFDTEYNLSSGTAQTINYIYINQDNTITIGRGDILLGYYFKGTTYNKWICCPDLCTTTPDKRYEREYDHLHIPNGIISYNNDTKKLGFNTASPDLYGEGINYNGNATDFNKRNLQEDIAFSYLNRDEDEASKTINWTIISDPVYTFQNTTTNYSIQTLILAADGTFFMIPGENKTSEPSKEAIFQDQHNFPPTIGIEMARVVLNGSTLNSLYFTNKNYIGSIQIAVGTASSTSSSFVSDKFEVHNADSTKKFEVNFGNSFILTNTGAEATYDLNTFNTINSTIGTPSDTASATGTLYARINQHTNEINNIASSIVKQGTSVPSAFDTWIFIKTDTKNVYIWDGSKYQLMNSWQ